MFHSSIVLSDAFIEMSADARCLYYTLGMLADDDGFVGGPKRAMRDIGATQEHLDELIDKKYILAFPSGVICIKHWGLNNYQRKDRKKDTPYVDELNMLEISDNGTYSFKETIMTTNCQPSMQPTVNQLTTNCQPSDNQVTTNCQPGAQPTCPPRIEENRIEENRIDYIYICQQVVDAYHSCCPSLPKVRELTDKRKKQIENRSKKYGLEDFKNVFTKAEQSDFLSGRSGTWKSCNFDWLINDSNMIKVLEGTYDNKASTNGFNNYEQRAYTNDLEMRLLQKNALI